MSGCDEFMKLHGYEFKAGRYVSKEEQDELGSSENIISELFNKVLNTEKE